eukprot:scaffold12019_cov19-Tisochrysis_lutea.AAC.1
MGLLSCSLLAAVSLRPHPPAPCSAALGVPLATELCARQGPIPSAVQLQREQGLPRAREGGRERLHLQALAASSAVLPGLEADGCLGKSREGRRMHSWPCSVHMAHVFPAASSSKPVYETYRCSHLLAPDLWSERRRGQH